nr:helix-turn-helix domain-containing protein [uncultured Psychroserpens sp.]
MELQDNLYNLFILFGTLQALIFGFLLLLKSTFKDATKYLGLCVFFLVLYLVWVLKASLGIQAHYPYLRFIPLFFLWGIGPAFYAYLRFFFRKPIPLKKLKLHFLPLWFEQLFFNSITLIFCINDFEPKNFNSFEHFLAFNVFEIEHYIGLFSIAYYLVLSIQLYRQQLKVDVNKKIAYILFCFILLWGIWVPYTIIDSIFYNFNYPVSEFYFFYFFLTAITYAIGFIGFRLSTQTTTKIKIEKTSEIQELAELFKSKMEMEKYYLNPNLNLKIFSEKLNVHPNKTSAVINDVIGYSFRDFVNSYRIEKFKRLAKDDKTKAKTILGMAFDSGFNSKASFNRAFKKFCNTTPVEYLENCK